MCCACFAVFIVFLMFTGTCPKPTISTHNQENGGTQVECAVHGAYPEPKMELQNSAYVMVKAENTKISQNGRYFDIILEAVVTKKDYYHCAVTQEEICHQIYSQKTMVHIPYGKLLLNCIGGLNICKMKIGFKKQDFKFF